jgi:hypothetical protein
VRGGVASLRSVTRPSVSRACDSALRGDSGRTPSAPCRAPGMAAPGAAAPLWPEAGSGGRLGTVSKGYDTDACTGSGWGVRRVVASQNALYRQARRQPAGIASPDTRLQMLRAVQLHVEAPRSLCMRVPEALPDFGWVVSAQLP